MSNKNSARILVVDDDPALCDLLTEYLTAGGLTVDTAGDGVAMSQRMDRHPPDIIVLDIMLPGEDGLNLARQLRAKSDVPILMLSARGEEIDRVVGLEVGADDYLAKPFSPRELLARLHALLRRTRQLGQARRHGQAGLGFGPFVLDIDARRLLRGEQEVKLTGAEFDLLKAFAERPNRVLSRDTLVDLLRGYDRDPFDRSIDIRVTRLRRKIEPDPGEPRYILTVRGEGYLFNPRSEAASAT
ncbi:MAG: response regulator [Rhodocyclaceae bacterium]|jgi:DNA-binding response OmpR family regulator|nr:response regulator [Rhodocyclaceae bacterium]